MRRHNHHNISRRKQKTACARLVTTQQRQRKPSRARSVHLGPIVNEFVMKIIVHAPDKSCGHRRQKIELVWNFIEEVNLPGDNKTVDQQRKGRTA